MKAKIYRHVLRDAVLAVVSGLILALAFAPSVVLAAAADTPWYFGGVLGAGFVLALFAVLLAQSFPFPKWHRRSRGGVLVASIAFGVGVATVAAVTGLLVASYGVSALTAWFFFGSLVMSVCYRSMENREDEDSE